MKGKKWLVLSVGLAIVLLASSVGGTMASFVDLESSGSNTFEAWTSVLWQQTSQSDFEAGVLNNVDTSSSAGDVKLEIALQEPTTSIGSEESWYFTSWSRRAPVTISNPDSGLTDYQVKVDVTFDDDMQPDFDDIRFVDSDDSSELSHWRESYTASTSAIFWVKVPSIPSGDKTIYMYYGNPSVNTASNGDSTFEFFDEGDQISSWTTGQVGTGSAGQSSTEGNPAPSYYVNSPSASSYAYMKRDIGLTTNKIIEFDMQTDTSLGPYYVLDVPFLVSSAGYGQHFRLEGRTGEKSGFAWKDNWTAFNWGVPASGTYYSTGTWYKARIEIDSTQANGWIDGDYQPTSPYTLRTTAGNTFIGIEWSGRIDNIRVRKYADPEPTTSVGAEDGWSRRAPVVINNPCSGLTDYQVEVDITYDADMQANFDDIRFVDSDDSTELSHWRESYTASTSAIFWVKVPSIPSGTKTIYMYYGNDAASSTSDGDKTFVFFDDFSGDLSKWNIHIDTDVAITSSYGNPAPCLEISGGITGSPYGFAAIGSDATYTGFQDGIIEADIYPATVALPEIIFRGDYSANTGYKGRWDCRSGTESPWMKPPYSGWAAFGTAVPRFGIAMQWQKAKLVIDGSIFKIYSNDSLKSTVTNTQYSGPGEIGLANHYGTYARFDNIRVRKYASQSIYVSPGTLASQVLDTGVAGASWNVLFWDEILTSNTDITFEVRASDTLFAKGDASPSWTSVGGTSPVTSGLPSGRYMQWRATLTTSDTSETPTLNEVRVYYY